MDDESKAILREIVACLKERNDASNKAQADALLRREESGKWMEQIRQNSPAIDLNKSRAEHDARMAELSVKSEEQRQERREFQAAILAEIRRLNENIETLITQGGSSGVLL